MKRLLDKTAIVSGAGSGIGRAIALRLAAEGARVGVLDICETGGETADAIDVAGGSALFIRCDVTDAGSVRVALDQIETHFGPLDLAVNNAGIAGVGTVLDTTEEDFDRIFAINVRGVFVCLKAEVERMRGRGGCIVNIGSIIAGVAVPERFAYSAAKAAVHAMSRAVACDFVKERIRCNTVAPARVHTPFVDGYLEKNYPGREAEMFEKLAAAQPAGRMGTPDEIAALVAYLCSDEAAFITGATLEIDGGFANMRL